MKPRTKRQIDVYNSAQKLCDIEKDIIDYAIKKAVVKKGFATKNRVICLQCGSKFSTELVSRKKAVCPNCQESLKITNSRCRTDKQYFIIGNAEIYGEYQVIRFFEVYSYHNVDKTAHYHCYEIMQQWVLDDGKYEIFGRLHTVNYHQDCWSGHMEIRKKYDRYYNTRQYDLIVDYWHPDSNFKQKHRKYGIDENHLFGITFLDALKNIPSNPRYETLLKAKQFNLLKAYSRVESNRNRNLIWSATKICIRNKYFVKDASLWIDYIDLLIYFGKDVCNSHYVCPKNLNKEHDRLMNKKSKVDKKRQLEARKKQMEIDQKEYEKNKSAFFGIAFKDKEITVSVLESVKDIMEEGEALHHCVYTNSYYNKSDSLILSARKRTKRLETIEVSLSKLKVVQCRGLQNKSSEYHDRIIKLVEDNMRLIAQRQSKKKRKKKVEEQLVA